jgi:hypothetical protein
MLIAASPVRIRIRVNSESEEKAMGRRRVTGW